MQKRRRRPDARSSAKFPLQIVPTYPGDAQFGSEFFAEFLTRAPGLVRTTLAEIFEGGA